MDNHEMVMYKAYDFISLPQNEQTVKIKYKILLHQIVTTPTIDKLAYQLVIRYRGESNKVYSYQICDDDVVH